MMKLQTKNIVGFLLVCVILALMPLFFGDYELHLLSQVACLSLFALSFTLLYSYAGLISFGQAAFFGVGAYACAMSIKYIPGIPFLAGILIGTVVAGVVACLIGLFCVRLTGAYFALMTVAFNQFLFAIAFKWRSVTGGEDGLAITKKLITLPFLGTFDILTSIGTYYLIVAVVIVCFLVCFWLTKTPYWNSVFCCKQNEERASFIGYNTYVTKVLIFTIAGIFGGIGGSLLVINENFVSTDVIDMSRSMHCLMMAFIGGANSIVGAAIGALIYTLFTDITSTYTPYWELILGCLFIVIIIFFREGFVNLFSKINTLMVQFMARK
jgi:branched-chain amino acid transport system permease protein